MTWEWLALVALLYTAHGANILAIFPIPAKSHNIAFSALTEELANRGHHVTAISSFPLKSPPQNYKDIQVKITLTEEFNTFLHGKMSLFHESIIAWEEGLKTCELFLKHTEVQQLIHSNSHHFDAIILEVFANECLLGFADKYKAPIIQICPFGGTHSMGNWVGNPNPFSYVPHPFGESTHEMSLWERLENTLVGLYWTLGIEYYSLPQQEAAMRKYFAASEPLPSLSELLRNTSLLLVNNHFSLSYPKPLVPNLVQVGGLHVKPPKKLPQDLQTYLDEAKDGVIYFSMGSILKGFQLPDAKRKAFLEAFSKLKQKVLWKWEAESLPGQPSNVKLGKWLPQPDILAHRNVKLFITHGGLLGMQEAMTHGVPLLGIPMYGDQSYNMKKTVGEGYGVLLDFDNITTQSLTWALETVLQPSYRKNAQRISRIFRDQPLTPLETAVFWTEYVIRHKGAPHMRSAALDLSWYQYYLLDVIAVLTLALVIATSVPVLIIRWLFRKCSDNLKKKKD